MRLNNLLTILFFLCSFGFANVEKTLNSLPESDREEIKFLFTYLIQRDSLGYVLFGESKCLTFTSIPLTHKQYFLPYKIENGFEFQKKLKASWFTWKSHEPKFKHSNMLICEKYEKIENEFFLNIFILDKKKLKTVLSIYKEDFIESLGEDFNIETFVSKLSRNRNLLSLINFDEKLLGILLGFGREASIAFKNWTQNEEIDPPLEYLGKRPKGCLIGPVSFRGYSSNPETHLILENYKKEILMIEEIFKKDNFLEITLEKFCQS